MSPTLEEASALEEFSQAVLNFPELQAVGVTVNRNPHLPPHLTFILVTPLSPDDPKTASHWDAVAEARAKHRRTIGRDGYFISLRSLDPGERNIDDLLREVSQGWDKENYTEVLLVAKIQKAS